MMKRFIRLIQLKVILKIMIDKKLDELNLNNRKKVKNMKLLMKRVNFLINTEAGEERLIQIIAPMKTMTKVMDQFFMILMVKVMGLR